MKKERLIISICLTLFSLNANANRSMYVDGFDAILGDLVAETKLLDYAQSNGIETLLLYGLHIVHANHNLTNPASNYILADFIENAKTNYGILSVGAVAENEDFFANVIDVYNYSREDALEKFDIYNLEFEFWSNSATGPDGYYCTSYLTPNGLPCTVDGAFQYYISILQTMDSLATNNPHTITTEAYVGWPAAGQADTIGANLDKLLLHAYVGDPNSAYNYAEDRLVAFANGNPGLDVSIIFSAEPDFMQTWLENNSMLAAENIFINDWNSTSPGWSNNINLTGFTYFTYSQMSSIFLPVGVGNIDEKKLAKIYPTLAQDHLFIELHEAICKVNLFYSDGTVVRTITDINQGDNLQIDVSDLIPGLYFITLKTESRIETYKFVKRN